MPSLLESAVHALGAESGGFEGVPAANSFGDVEREARALATATGLVPFLGTAVFEVSGDDAPAFLHRVLSQDVARFLPGHARRACLLSPQGRVLMDPVVWRFEERFLLVLSADTARGGIPALARYVIADDVAIEDVSSRWSLLLVAGPSSPAALARGGVPAPEPGAFLPADALAAEALVLRRDVGAVPAFDVLVPGAAAGLALWHLAAIDGVTLAGEAAYDALRVEAGAPRWGAEIDGRVLPTEAGLEDAVSWTKGCYVGQEAVVMARRRGHPPTLLARLAIPGGAAPARGAALLHSGAPAGRVTTAARGVTRRDVLALALVRFDLAKVGATFSVEGPSPTSATLEALLAR